MEGSAYAIRCIIYAAFFFSNCDPYRLLIFFFYDIGCKLLNCLAYGKDIGEGSTINLPRSSLAHQSKVVGLNIFLSSDCLWGHLTSHNHIKMVMRGAGEISVLNRTIFTKKNIHE